MSSVMEEEGLMASSWFATVCSGVCVCVYTQVWTDSL